MVIFICSSTNTTATASFEREYLFFGVGSMDMHMHHLMQETMRNILKIPIFFRKLKTKPYQCMLLLGCTQVTDSKTQLP